MPKLEMGAGFKVLTYFIILCAITGASFLAGSSYNENKQTESNIEVISNDSEVALEISQETKLQRDKTNADFEKVGSSNGYLTDDGLQFLLTTISAQKQRTDETSIIDAITRK